jgi:ubiquilin
MFVQIKPKPFSSLVFSMPSSVTIKVQSGDELVVSVDIAYDSVESLKSRITLQTDISVEKQRLVYKGKVLQNNDTLVDYGIADGSVIHCVKINPPSSSSAASAAVAGSSSSSQLTPQLNSFQNHLMTNPDILGEMLNSPPMQQLLNNQSVMNSLITSNPQIQPILEKNPELRALLQDPEFFKQSLEMMRNPQLMREVVRNSDRAMSNIDSIPGGYNLLKKVYEDIQKPLDEAMAAGHVIPAETTSGSKDAGKKGQPLPNPWGPVTTAKAAPFSLAQGAPSMPADMWSGVAGMMQDPNMQQMLMGMMGGPATKKAADGAATGSKLQGNSNPMATLFDSNFLRAFGQLEEHVTAGSADSSANVTNNFSDFLRFSEGNKEVKYKYELQQMKSMGFDDVNKNIDALERSNGEVSKAIDYLIDQINQEAGPITNNK